MLTLTLCLAFVLFLGGYFGSYFFFNAINKD